jgi:hypothetical protein
VVVESAVADSQSVKPRTRMWSVLLVSIATVLVVSAVIPVASKAKYQLALVPPLLLLLWRTRLFKVPIPKLIPMCIAVGASIGAVVQLSHVGLASGAFLVSTVSDRDLQQEAKIYRDRLRKSIGVKGESLVGVFPSVIRDATSAQRMLERSPSLGGVIWGSPRWMSVTLRQYDPISLGSLPERSVARDLLTARNVPDLTLMRSVPYVGMSHGHERGTVYFLGEIVKIWRSIPAATAIGAASGDFEGGLEALARTQARWTSRSHMALPLWLAGTVHLLRAIESDSLQAGELACALTELREALMQFRTDDNPTLQMSVRNNYAVALAVQAQYSQEHRKLRKKALQQLAAAVKLRRYDSTIGSVVAMNYAGLVQAQKRSKSNDRKR